VISAVNPNGFKSWFIRDLTLHTPKLNDTEWDTVQEMFNGTSYELTLIGDNGLGKPVSSLVYTLDREPKKDDSKGSGGGSSGGTPWWVWFLVSIAIVVAIALAVTGVLFYRRRKARRAVPPPSSPNRPLVDSEMINYYAGDDD
jgi:hypothetical protein